MVDIIEVGENIYQMDDHLYDITEWGSVYVINEEKKALVDTGPTTSAATVLTGIKQLDLRPDDIDYIIVTHIHLDHGGGAGFLLREMPGAQVVVHQRGAKHMVNPERLINSKRASQGEESLAGDGEMVPVPENRIMPVQDGDELILGDKQMLEIMDAPGHAPHELCIYEKRNRGVFTGDAAGVATTNGRIHLPSSPAPNFDYEKYTATMKRIMDLNATRLYRGHFGVNTRVQESLEAVMAKMRRWHDMVMAAIKEDNADGLPERMKLLEMPELEQARDNAALYRQLTTSSLPSSVRGFLKYYRDQNLLN
ncbi:MBL fold metallo-hydrolase [Chloroflexota bacterium]